MAGRNSFCPANEKDIHCRENRQVTDQLLRRQKSDSEIERDPQRQNDQARQETRQEGESGRRFDHTNREDEAIVGKPIDAELVPDVEMRVLLKEFLSEF